MTFAGAHPWNSSRASGALAAALVAIAAGLVFVSWGAALAAARAHPLDVAVYLGLTAALTLLAVDVEGRGSISVAGVTLLAIGFTYGAGAGVYAAVGAAGVHALRRGSRPQRALLNAATLALATGAGVESFLLIPRSGSPVLVLVAATLAGVSFWLVSIGLLTTVTARSRQLPMRNVFDDQFRWLTLHYLAFGPLALACAIGLVKVGLVGLVAFALPPALLLVSIQGYMRKTRAAVAEVEEANHALRRSNADLRDLFEFASGLSAHRHDSRALADHAQASLERLVGGEVEVSIGSEFAESEGALVSAGRVVGAVRIEGGDEERWLRLCEAIRPQLATALESAILADEARKSHLSTIAALSRSLEAKDTYTGAHTDRVAAVALALARRLGYRDAELDAISIGALLHDIGKIGIPEAILHKSGPLDNDEWTVMKRHPIVSEFILSGADLHPFVLQIARSSHERMDGLGYPDGMSGDAIPLPARIVLVADAFDALTTDRPYRRARRPRAAIDEILANTGEQFCPLVVAALERVYQQEPALLGEVERLTIVA